MFYNNYNYRTVIICRFANSEFHYPEQMNRKVRNVVLFCSIFLYFALFCCLNKDNYPNHPSLSVYEHAPHAIQAVSWSSPAGLSRLLGELSGNFTQKLVRKLYAENSSYFLRYM